MAWRVMIVESAFRGPQKGAQMAETARERDRLTRWTVVGAAAGYA